MGRYGMAGDHYRQSGYVTLQDVPDPNREYVESFQNLTGGINRFDLDYRLKGNESPFMQNLSWHNGTLTSRLGQVEKFTAQTFGGTVKSAAQFLFHGWLLIAWERHVEDPETDYFGVTAVKVVQTGESENEKANGTTVSLFTASGVTDFAVFFRYREDVYCKLKGEYFGVHWLKTNDTLNEVPIADADRGTEYSGPAAFVPMIQIDTNPTSGAGNLFQPENRICSYKSVQYNPVSGVKVYQLPVKDIESVYEIKVDGRTLPASRYTVNTTDGTVSFLDSQGVPAEPTTEGGSVIITYKKPNVQAYDSIIYSKVAAVFGGTQELCIVMGDTPTQPNAYFWSGHDSNTMNPTYFPMNQYNLVGDNDDPITAMGKQQNMLVIFQGSSTGRAVFGTETLEGLVQVTMNYTRINAEIGCDLPGSLQLVENNLVWCNRKYGVCRLKDSSAAYENNIVQISRKINGDYRLDGLLEQLKSVADDAVRSVDTGKRYILVLGDEDGKAYEWNYELSQYDNPSWFFHTNILGVGFVPLANEELYEVTADGKVCTFEMVFSDFGTEPINKIYRFPPRDFGSYDRLKNIKSILVTTRSDAKTNTQLKYTCDYAERVDPTNLVVLLNRLLYAAVFRRKPGYHNIHHLGIELSNNVAGDDLNIVSAQIYYEYRGRTR